jgi:hypothetical protein
MHHAKSASTKSSLKKIRMKFSKSIIVASIVLLASCNGNQPTEHGHEHDAQTHGHEHEGAEEHDHLEQEEFTISADSVNVEEPAHHTHEDGSEHHNHE